MNGLASHRHTMFQLERKVLAVIPMMRRVTTYLLKIQFITIKHIYSS